MDLKQRVRLIVAKATVLKDKYEIGKNIPVNYACVFSQSASEYEDLLKEAAKLGKVVKVYNVLIIIRKLWNFSIIS